MFKRIVPVFLLSLMMSLMLVACGGEATVPSYTGGTAVTVSDKLKNQFTSGVSNVKNVKVEAYKTTDDAGKVKTFFNDNFSKNGWDNKSSELGDAAKSMEQIKGFALGYQKDNKAAVVMGLPGSTAGLLGFEGVGEKDTLYLVLTGEK